MLTTLTGQRPFINSTPPSAPPMSYDSVELIPVTPEVDPGSLPTITEVKCIEKHNVKEMYRQLENPSLLGIVKTALAHQLTQTALPIGEFPSRSKESYMDRVSQLQDLLNTERSGLHLDLGIRQTFKIPVKDPVTDIWVERTIESYFPYEELTKTKATQEVVDRILTARANYRGILKDAKGNIKIIFRLPFESDPLYLQQEIIHGIGQAVLNIREGQSNILVPSSPEVIEAVTDYKIILQKEARFIPVTDEQSKYLEEQYLKDNNINANVDIRLPKYCPTMDVEKLFCCVRSSDTSYLKRTGEF